MAGRGGWGLRFGRRRGGGTPAEPTAPVIVANVIAPETGEVGTTFGGAPTVTGSPTPTLAYQWQSSADGSTGWTNIEGATAQGFESVAATFMRRLVTATSSQGSDGPDASNVVQVTAVTAGVFETGVFEEGVFA